MRTFKLIVAYDGTAFRGWQRQPNLRTVQGVVEDGLRELLGDPELALAAAGRTDAGVHARGQATSFRAETHLPARAFAPLLNARLPSDVRVREAIEAAETFHARHSACARHYVYRLLREEDVLLGRFAWCPRRTFEVEPLQRAVTPLVGEHDFSAFQSTGSTQVPPVCKVLKASWSASARGACFAIVADHFLYRMVRNVVATALFIARTRDPGAAMQAILASRERSRAGATAPARGLTLERVLYAGDTR